MPSEHPLTDEAALFHDVLRRSMIHVAYGIQPSDIERSSQIAHRSEDLGRVTAPPCIAGQQVAGRCDVGDFRTRGRYCRAESDRLERTRDKDRIPIVAIQSR